MSVPPPPHAPLVPLCGTCASGLGLWDGTRIGTGVTAVYGPAGGLVRGFATASPNQPEIARLEAREVIWSGAGGRIGGHRVGTLPTL